MINDNRKYFITDLLKFNGYKTYLELGVWHSETITHIQKLLKVKCTGVDINDVTNTGFIFYKCTTDEFFENNSNTFDCIFIDACHRVDFVKKDLTNSLEVLNKNGIIILHDIDPIKESYVDEVGFDYCSNAYRVIDWIYDNHPELNVVILPIDETGMAIVNRKMDRRFTK